MQVIYKTTFTPNYLSIDQNEYSSDLIKRNESHVDLVQNEFIEMVVKGYLGLSETENPLSMTFHSKLL